MPGANCAIYGCGTCRRGKGVSIWKLPSPKDKFHEEWRKDLLNVITRDRVMNDSLKRQIKNDKLFICEKHFTPDKFYIYPNRKSMKEGALPTLNLPQKSIVSSTAPPRPSNAIDKREQFKELCSLTPTTSKCFKNFRDFITKIQKFQLEGWNFDVHEDFVEISMPMEGLMISKYQIFADVNLDISVRVYGWMLPPNNELYSSIGKSFYEITPSKFLQAISGDYKICQGIDRVDVFDLINTSKHTIPKVFNFVDWKENPALPLQDQLEYLRSKLCFVLMKNDDVSQCSSCKKLDITTKIDLNRKNANLQLPVSSKAPLKFVSHDRLRAPVQHQKIVKLVVG